MFTVNLEQIGSIESACGRMTTHLFAVSPGIVSLNFSRFSDNVVSCIFHPLNHVLEVTMETGSRPEFEIDFQGDLGINLFEDFPIHDFPYQDGVCGTFVGVREGGLKPTARNVNYAEITEQISTGSAS